MTYTPEELTPAEEVTQQAEWFAAVRATEEVIKSLPLRYDPFINEVARRANCGLDVVRLVVEDLERHGFLHWHDHTHVESDFR